MDIKRTSGKPVSASQRDSFIAQSNQTTIRKPWKSLATVVFGLFLSVPGLTQAQYIFTTIDASTYVPNATATSVNGNSTNAIAGDFNDANGNLHGFVLNNGVFTTIDVPDALDPGVVFATSVNGINETFVILHCWFTYGDKRKLSHTAERTVAVTK